MNLVIDFAEWYGKLAQESSNSPKDEFFLEAARQIKTGEEWKSGQQEEPTPRPISDFGSEIILPFPFQTARPSLYRKGDIYSVEFGAILKYNALNNRNIFDVVEGMESRLSKKYSDRWARISDSYGFVLDEEGEPYVAMGLNPGGTYYEVIMGNRGTTQRAFGSREDFKKDMILFGTAINNAVNAGIDFAVGLKMLESNPPIRLTLR
ncbi:MAG: hypothetical protein Q8N63_07765 [Nanoarchaeota archaeon]|nr:hypothetical protein [Nanoarchaeota archaeon]